MTIFFLGLDGVIVDSYMKTPNRDFFTWKVLDGTRERLESLVARGDWVGGIITNQGAVAFDLGVSEADVKTKIERAAELAGIGGCWYTYCCAHPKSKDPRYLDASRRLPSPLMLQEAMAAFKVGPDGITFVGALEDERQACAAAGVRFIEAEVFFAEATI